MKDVVVIQPKNLGDVIFVMAIAQKYANEGHKVYYPVDGRILKFPSIQKNFPEVIFMKTTEFPNFVEIHKKNITEDDNYIYLPFIYNYINEKHYDHMKYKYSLLNFPLDMWREVKITRDLDSEKRLIDFLEINQYEKFNLVNKNYSRSKRSRLIITPHNNYRTIFLEKIEGFNLFDWIGVIERSTSVHTVHTSLHYILEVLPNITNDLHIYPRKELGQQHSLYDFLFKKEYVYH